MRKILIAMAAAAIGAGAVAADKPAVSADPEAQLAAALDGRTAGRSQQCVQLRNLRGNRGIGENIVLFDGPGSTIFVNRTRGDCPQIRPWNTVRIDTVGGTLCANEIIRVVDLQTGVDYGGCALGEFTPFSRND